MKKIKITENQLKKLITNIREDVMKSKKLKENKDIKIIEREFTADYRHWLVENDVLYLLTKSGEWKFAGKIEDVKAGNHNLDGWSYYEVWNAVEEHLPEWSSKPEPKEPTPEVCETPSRRWKGVGMKGGVLYTRKEDGAKVFIWSHSGGYASPSSDDRSFRPGGSGGTYTGLKSSSCERSDEQLDYKWKMEEAERMATWKKFGYKPEGWEPRSS